MENTVAVYHYGAASMEAAILPHTDEARSKLIVILLVLQREQGTGPLQFSPHNPFMNPNPLALNPKP